MVSTASCPPSQKNARACPEPAEGTGHPQFQNGKRRTSGKGGAPGRRSLQPAVLEPICLCDEPPLSIVDLNGLGGPCQNTIPGWIPLPGQNSQADSDPPGPVCLDKYESAKSYFDSVVDDTVFQAEVNYVRQVNQTLGTPPPGNWVPAGGNYLRTGCLREAGGDGVWCPSSVPAAIGGAANNGPQVQNPPTTPDPHTRKYSEYLSCVINGWADSKLSKFLGADLLAYNAAKPAARTGTRLISGGRFSPGVQAVADTAFYVFAAATAFYTVESAVAIRSTCTAEVYGK